jgi:hypothetical protein
MSQLSAQQGVYECTALVGTNKKGHLPCDEDGYYTLMVGGLNTFNSSGAYYPLEPAKALFQDSSGLMRRIANGNCKGECGHPKPLPGQSTREFIQRVLQIEETRVCCHFRRIWLEPQQDNGRSFTAILAEVKPSGPMGPALKEALDNVHDNVCFSIRSITHDRITPAGYVEKSIRTIVGFDWVTEPGIRFAHKYQSPALEGLSERLFTNQDLPPLPIAQSAEVASMEASLATDVRTALGWSTESIPTRPYPLSTHW